MEYIAMLLHAPLMLVAHTLYAGAIIGNTEWMFRSPLRTGRPGAGTSAPHPAMESRALLSHVLSMLLPHTLYAGAIIGNTEWLSRSPLRTGRPGAGTPAPTSSCDGI